MFKKVPLNVHLHASSSFSVSRVLDKSVGSGNVRSRVFVRSDVSNFVKEFPSPDVFSLENQVKSGVPLKEVNSVVFDSPLTNNELDLINSKLSDVDSSDSPDSSNN